MTIYCPGCGVKVSAEQKFCRSCGMELQIISQSVAKHFGESAEVSESQHKRLDRWGKIISLTGLSILTLLLTCVFICLAISKIFGLRFEDFGFDFIGPLVVGIALPLLFVGAGMTIYPQIIKELFSRRPQQPALPPAETTRMLFSETPVESMESITEHTTELLGTSEARDTARIPHGEMKD